MTFAFRSFTPRVAGAPVGVERGGYQISSSVKPKESFSPVKVPVPERLTRLFSPDKVSAIRCETVSWTELDLWCLDGMPVSRRLARYSELGLRGRRAVASHLS